MSRLPPDGGIVFGICSNTLCVMKTHRKILAAALALVVVSTLSGCALIGLPAPGLYDRVDSEAKKLHLKDMGELQCVGNSGLGLFDDVPTFKAVLLGPDARNLLQNKLVTTGYTQLGRDLPDSSIFELLDKDKSTAINTAEVFLVHPGDRITLQGQKDCVATEAGAAIYIK